MKKTPIIVIIVVLAIGLIVSLTIGKKDKVTTNKATPWRWATKKVTAWPPNLKG